MTFYSINVRYRFLFVLIFLSTGVITAQRNISLSPARMGPNALPIPEIRMGTITSSIQLRAAYETHSSEGDNTQNTYLQLDIPVVKNRVGFRMFVVPSESFTLTDAIKEERNIQEPGNKGTAGGDIYVETQFQLLTEKKYGLDVLLNIGFKTASGTNLEFARFTDSPGYFFDASFGKTVWNQEATGRFLRLYGQGGFYVYQTNRITYRQNDAVSYGIGVFFKARKWSLKNDVGGYRGYINFGDRFNAFRSTFRTHFDGWINVEARFQQGITYNDYTSFRLGCIINLDGAVKWFEK